MNIHELLSSDTVVTNLSARGKEDAIVQMVNMLDGHPAISDIETVRKAVLERERIMSTGVGKGIALPHAKSSTISSTAAVLVTTKEPVEFGSLDNKPVSLIFLLIGNSESKSEHIRILSRISRLLNQDALRVKLLASSSGNELLQLLKEEELRMTSTNQRQTS